MKFEKKLLKRMICKTHSQHHYEILGEKILRQHYSEHTSERSYELVFKFNNGIYRTEYITDGFLCIEPYDSETDWIECQSVESISHEGNSSKYILRMLEPTEEDKILDNLVGAGDLTMSKTFLETLNHMDEEGYPEEALILMFKKREAIISHDFELCDKYAGEIEDLLPKLFPFNPDWDVTDCRPSSSKICDWKNHVLYLEGIVLNLQKNVDCKDAIISDWQDKEVRNNGPWIEEKAFTGDSDHEKE